MNKTIVSLMILSVIFLLGCQQIAPQPPAEAVPAAQPAPSAVVEPSQGVIVTAGDQAEPATEEEVPPAPLENIPTPAKEGLDLGRACYDLLLPEEFPALCGKDNAVVLTPKISEGSCWVNVADHKNNKLTAGFTTVNWKNAEDANKEFNRGVSSRRTQGAVEGKIVGERSYEYKELGRHNIVWVRGALLTKMGAMTDLCPADKLVEVAKAVDERLR